MEAKPLPAAHSLGPHKWVTKPLLLPIENKRGCKNSAFLISHIPEALVGSTMRGTMVASFLQEKREEQQDIFWFNEDFVLQWAL